MGRVIVEFSAIVDDFMGIGDSGDEAEDIVLLHEWMESSVLFGVWSQWAGRGVRP